MRVRGCRFCLPVSVLPTGFRLRRLISSSDDRPAFVSGKRRLSKRRLRRLLSPGDDVLLRIVLAGTDRSAIQFFVVRLPLALFFRRLFSPIDLVFTSSSLSLSLKMPDLLMQDSRIEGSIVDVDVLFRIVDLPVLALLFEPL